MKKLSVESAKKQIIAQIKRKKGLFENCGDAEIRTLYEQAGCVWDCNCESLQKWIDSLDCNSIKQYLKQHTKYVEIPYDDLLTITAVIDRAIAEKESRNDMCQIDVFRDVARRLHGGKYQIINK